MGKACIPQCVKVSSVAISCRVGMPRQTEAVCRRVARNLGRPMLSPMLSPILMGDDEAGSALSWTEQLRP